VLQDGPLDDRDAGVVCLGGQRLLATWFCSDTRQYYPPDKLETLDSASRPIWEQGLARQNDEIAARWLGSWSRISDDGGETWRVPIRVPINAPHGPIRLRRGGLLYLGKEFFADMQCFKSGVGRVIAAASDDGIAWRLLGEVPLYPNTTNGSYHEAHVAELADGKLIGMIRIQNHGPDRLESSGVMHFSMMQTESIDGGLTWSTARPLNFHGSPPHLIQHSSGVLILSYGYRLEPYGQRVAISHDGGLTWENDFILRDDGPDSDLGYPATVELTDHSLCTVYYQKPKRVEDKCALLYSRWTLP
jgi:hypothetical protein